MSAALPVWRGAAGLEWLEWETGGVTAVFPTRAGGESRPPRNSLNLSLSAGDEPSVVLENRMRFCAAVGLPLRRLIVPRQVHGTIVRSVGEAEAGAGASDAEAAIGECDGLVTDTPALGLGISTADCLPIVIVAVTPTGPALAAVHAGWRGVIKGIAGQAAVALAQRGRLLGAVIGPSIGPCCFAVDEALRVRFASQYSGVVRGAAVDLAAAAATDLERAGVPAGTIVESGICTSCDERFFSHRRDRGLTGRHLAIAWRRPDDSGARITWRST